MHSRIINTSTTKRANQKLVLNLLRRTEAASPASMAREFHVPVGTISRVVAGLLEAELIRVSDSPPPSGRVGKPPIILEINRDYAALLGIELNEQMIRVVTCDFTGTILFECAEKTKPEPEDILTEQLPGLVRKMLRKCARQGARVKWVGIGVSGLVNAETGRIIHGFLPYDTDIPALIRRQFSLASTIDNDANLTAVAELHFGVGRSRKNMISLLDRGWVGAGFIMDGKLYAGSHHAAGELTAGIHAAIPGNGGAEANDSIAQFPFIESYGLERRVQKLGFMPNMEHFSSRAEFIQFLCEQATRGDERAGQLIQQEVVHFAEAIIRLTKLFDPELVVIQGDFAAAGPDIEKRVRAEVERRHQQDWRYLPLPEVMFSRLAQNSVTLGAVSRGIATLTDQVL